MFLVPSFAAAQELQPPAPLDPATGQPVQTQPQPAPTDGQTGAAPTETTERLDTSEKEDSGRGLEFFYVNGGVGLGYVGLETFNSDKLALQNTSRGATELDLGLGLRLLILTIGPRVRTYIASGYDLWQIDGEIGVHLPISKLDIGFGAHGGYAFLGALTNDAIATGTTVTPSSDVRVRGFDVGLDFGIDYYLSPVFSLGGVANGELLVLKRPAVATTTDPTFGASGGSVGLGAAIGLRAGLHL